MKPPKPTNTKFKTLLNVALEDATLQSVLQPLKAIADKLDEEIVALDRRIEDRAKASEPCRLLMTAPDVDPMVALTYVAGMDDPARFVKSKNVGAYFGLTPRRYQSGSMDWSGGISRAGDAGIRRALYRAANVLIHHSQGWCVLKSRAVRLAAHRGLGKAKVDPAWEQGFRGAELLDNGQRRVVRQHDAAGTDTDGGGASCNICNQNRRRSARDPRHVVVLGQPVPLEPTALSALGELQGIAIGPHSVASLHNGDKIKNGEGDQHASPSLGQHEGCRNAPPLFHWISASPTPLCG